MLKKGSGKTKFRSEYPVDFKFDFKDASTISKFIIEGAKIIPSRISKLSSMQQRAVANAVKRARNIALLPLGADAYDKMHYPEPISPKPFKID
ncbi:MAG: 30S ribosomal protein S18 [Bdellovibrionota bacterium]